MARQGEAVRPAVALALVKLVRRLPAAAAGTALPRALQGVANLLRNRLQRIRHATSSHHLAQVKHKFTERIFSFADFLPAFTQASVEGNVYDCPKSPLPVKAYVLCEPSFPDAKRPS